MLIPNLVGGNSQLTLAVPDPSYWCSTAAEYYINIPGYDTETACIWGDSSHPYGNWAPFVAGANKASDGNTYVMVGINPIFCCEANAFAGTDPGFAIRLECPDGGCNGMPCECNPATMGPNKCTGGTVGAGGAEFCTVTVPNGGSAQLVIFSTANNSVPSSSYVAKPILVMLFMLQFHQLKLQLQLQRHPRMNTSTLLPRLRLQVPVTRIALRQHRAIGRLQVRCRCIASLLVVIPRRRLKSLPRAVDLINIHPRVALQQLLHLQILQLQLHLLPPNRHLLSK